MLCDLSKFSKKDDEIIQTGILPFDITIGGVVRGKVMEVFSQSGVGKSTLAMSIIRNLVAQGERCLYIDVERGVQDSVLSSYGLDVYNLPDYKGMFAILNPVTYSDVENILDTTIGPKAKNRFKFVVIDSVTMLMPAKMAEAESVYDVQDIAINARQSTLLLQKIKVLCDITQATVLLISQMRYKNKGTARFMRMELDSASGQAGEFIPDIRFTLQKGEPILKGEKTIMNDQKIVAGNVSKIMSIKNRIRRPLIPVKCPVIYGRGVSNLYFIGEVLMDSGLGTKARNGVVTVQLPGFSTPEIKVRGMQLLYEYIRGNYDELVSYLYANGYFDLIKGEDVPHSVEEGIEGGDYIVGDDTSSDSTNPVEDNSTEL